MSNLKNKCVVFDLDGTLLNTLQTIAYHGNETLKHFGLGEISEERYKILVAALFAELKMYRMKFGVA